MSNADILRLLVDVARGLADAVWLAVGVVLGGGLMWELIRIRDASAAAAAGDALPPWPEDVYRNPATALRCDQLFYPFWPAERCPPARPCINHRILANLEWKVGRVPQ